MTEGENRLAKGFAIQIRVIKALLMREIITRYGRHNIGFLWLFLEPMLFTLGVMALWSIVKASHSTDIPIAAFAITGYSSILLWRNCSNRCVKAIEPNLSLLYHRHVKVVDVFWARCLLEIAGATFSLIVLTFTFVFLEMMPWPIDIFRILIGWVLLSWFAVSLSLIVGAASERTELVDRIWHVITYLLFPLSGSAFMVDWLPATMQKVILALPMVHGVEMIRHGYFGDAVQTYENPVYMAVCSLVMTLIGLAMARETGRRVVPE